MTRKMGRLRGTGIGWESGGQEAPSGVQGLSPWLGSEAKPQKAKQRFRLSCDVSVFCGVVSDCIYSTVYPLLLELVKYSLQNDSTVRHHIPGLTC